MVSKWYLNGLSCPPWPGMTIFYHFGSILGSISQSIPKYHFSLNIFVEGLLNSRPRVCLLLAEFAVFGPPRATRTLLLLSLLLLLLLLLLLSPPSFFMNLVRLRFGNLIWGLEKASGALVKCIYAEFREESRGNDERL